MKWMAFVLLCAAGITAFFLLSRKGQISIISPIGTGVVFSRPLSKYSITQLRVKSVSASNITLGNIIQTTDSFIVRSFYFQSDGKKVSGIAHIPMGSGPFPVIIQLRGYVDPSMYMPGMGTERSAEVFAKNGYISLAPDFLGYGSSDPLSDNIFQDRFETYTTVLSLLASVGSFPAVDATRIGLWGHSNGGQIAITVLEILQKPIPAVLWAPVTKSFPYSIIYYTDDADDHGKYLRKELADFESQYDVENYSLTNYLDSIEGPIQIHQGGKDTAVPIEWNDIFADILKKEGKAITYFTYPNADHNMVPDWNTVVQRDIGFFKKYLP